MEMPLASSSPLAGTLATAPMPTVFCDPRKAWGNVAGHDSWKGALWRLVIWTLFSRDDGE